MATKLTAFADPKEQLSIKINAYNQLIVRLSQAFNCLSYSKVSFFVTGKYTDSKELNLSIPLGLDLPVPEDRLKSFLGDYCQDLINERAKLIAQLEGLENPVLELNSQELITTAPPEDPALQFEPKEAFCPVCVKETMHTMHQAGGIFIYQCDCCSNPNPNIEID